MKNRLIVAAIGIPALLAVIFFTPIWGWGIVVAIMAAFCAWELLHTAMPKFVPRFAVYAGVCGAAIVLGAAFGKSELVFKIAAYVLFVTMFIEMMISFHKPERIPFQDLALVFTAGIVIPWMLSSLVRLGLNDPKAPYLLLPFVITWLSDSGAFFVGRSLGKTKLAPALSPHKTVEGCVGGFVCAIAAAMLYGRTAPVRLPRADRSARHLRFLRQPCRTDGRPGVFRHQARARREGLQQSAARSRRYARPV